MRFMVVVVVITSPPPQPPPPTDENKFAKFHHLTMLMNMGYNTSFDGSY